MRRLHAYPSSAKRWFTAESKLTTCSSSAAGVGSCLIRRATAERRASIGTVTRTRGSRPPRSTLALGQPYALVPVWEAFTGKSPCDTWSVPLGLVLPEAVRHEQGQRRVGELADELDRVNGPVTEKELAAGAYSGLAER